MKKKNNRKSRKENTKNNSSQLASKPNTKYEKKQKRYLEKKANDKKVNKIPDKLSKYQLEEAKNKLEPLVHEANMRIEMITSSGYTSYALDRVIKEGGVDYFSLDDVKTREELVRESTRLRVFINDKGSTIDGAKLETAQIYADEYKGKFGNQFHNEENNFKNYDTKVIKSEIAEKAFRSYRILEEDRSSNISLKTGGYGSENLINALYDAEIRGLDSQMYGKELLDSFVEINSKEGERSREKANLISGITGIVEDNITGGYLF